MNFDLGNILYIFVINIKFLKICFSVVNKTYKKWVYIEFQYHKQKKKKRNTFVGKNVENGI